MYSPEILKPASGGCRVRNSVCCCVELSVPQAQAFLLLLEAITNEKIVKLIYVPCRDPFVYPRV